MDLTKRSSMGQLHRATSVFLKFDFILSPFVFESHCLAPKISPFLWKRLTIKYYLAYRIGVQFYIIIVVKSRPTPQYLSSHPLTFAPVLSAHCTFSCIWGWHSTYPKLAWWRESPRKNADTGCPLVIPEWQGFLLQPKPYTVTTLPPNILHLFFAKKFKTVSICVYSM